jgi:hypothetical protein
MHRICAGMPIGAAARHAAVTRTGNTFRLRPAAGGFPGDAAAGGFPSYTALGCHSIDAAIGAFSIVTESFHP